jgi:hypothetical protein
MAAADTMAMAMTSKPAILASWFDWNASRT